MGTGNLAAFSGFIICFWQLAAGSWLLAAGFWLLAAGFWQLASGSWQLAAGSWQLAAFPECLPLKFLFRLGNLLPG